MKIFKRVSVKFSFVILNIFLSSALDDFGDKNNYPRSWSSCDKTCGGGSRKRKVCYSIGPTSCHGRRDESDTCNTNACKIHGQWSSWSEWSDCDKTCNGGVQSLTKECNDPAPMNNGNECDGNGIETNFCNTHHCEGCNIVLDQRAIINTLDAQECRSMGFCYYLVDKMCYMKEGLPGRRFEISDESVSIHDHKIISIYNEISRIQCAMRCQRIKQCNNQIFEEHNKVEKTGRCYLLQESMGEDIEF